MHVHLCYQTFKELARQLNGCAPCWAVGPYQQRLRLSMDQIQPHHSSTRGTQLTRPEEVDRVDPRGLLVLLVVPNQNMQTADVLELDET